MAVDYTKLLDGNSLKAIRTWVTTNYQPLHANLTSISLLATNITGLIKMTNGVASLDGTAYAPLAGPTFTGTVTIPTTTKISNLTSTGLVKYTNGVLSIDTNSYVKANNAITGATKCKITYDAKGLVTKGENLAASDIPDLSSTYVALTGAQTITGAKTFKGAVTFTSATSGSGSTTIEHYYDPNGDSPINELRFNGYSAVFNNGIKTSSARIESIWSYNNSLITGNPNALILGDSESGSYILANGAYDDYSTSGNNYPGIMFKTLYSNQSGGGCSLATYGLKVPNTRGYTENRIIATTTDLTAYVANSTKGQANGVASLDANGKVPTSQLPESVVGALEYKGTFNANTGSTITGLEKGWYYICSTKGSKNPDKSTGPTGGYDVGDWAVYNGTSWDKIDNTDDFSGVVRYDQAQSLTDAQKLQARSNIGFSNQTAYATKGSAYKVPQITTNALGQVTLITEVDIAAASIVDTAGSESITVATSASASKTLNVVTRNTDQTITGLKTFKQAATGQKSGLSICWVPNGNPSGHSLQSGLAAHIYPAWIEESANLDNGKFMHIGFSDDGGNYNTGIALLSGSGHVYIAHYGTDVAPGQYSDGLYLLDSENTATRNTWSKILNDKDVILVKSMAGTDKIYTEQEALAILNGTAS